MVKSMNVKANKKSLNTLNDKRKTDAFIEAKPLDFVCLACILIFVFSVFYINFSCNAFYYNGDIYSDVILSKLMWEKKTLFPDNWVFGNQVYTVATPVFAALFYGIVKNQLLAMALASSLMTLFIYFSFIWMLKPVASFKAISGGFISLVTFVALFGDPIVKRSSWQLFFTMASYYSCYLITAMLCFGCYIRIRRKTEMTFSFYIIAALTVLTCFATGIQSLRQTEIMIIPMVITESLSFLFCKIKKKNVNTNSIIFVIIISVANVIGIIFAKFLKINQVTIIETTKIKILSIKEIIIKTLDLIFSIAYECNIYQIIGIIILLILSLFGIITAFIKAVKEKTSYEFIIILSDVIIGLIGIWMLMSFTTMGIRDVHFFMIVFLVSLPITYILEKNNKTIKLSLYCIIIICFCGALILQVFPALNKCTEKSLLKPYKEIVEEIEKEEVEVVYADWYVVGRISLLSSNKQLLSGMVSFEDGKTSPIGYLNNTDAFKENMNATYIVPSYSFKDFKKAADEKNAKIKVLSQKRVNHNGRDIYADFYIIVSNDYLFD